MMVLFQAAQREILNAEEIKLTTALENNTTSISNLITNDYAKNSKLTIYPNPCETTAKIAFDLPKTAQTTIKIMNLQGKTMVNLRNEKMNKGWHTIDWNMQKDKAVFAEKGIYLVQIQQENFIFTEKVIIL